MKFVIGQQVYLVEDDGPRAWRDTWIVTDAYYLNEVYGGGDCGPEHERYRIERRDMVRNAVRREQLASTRLAAQVAAFHRVIGNADRATPGPIPEERVRLRARLIAEEAFETLEAMFSGEQSAQILKKMKGDLLNRVSLSLDVRVDLPALADGLGDLDYVVEGTRLEFGIDGAPVAEEIQRANIAKQGGPCSPEGKQLKPEGWMPPDVAGVLRRQGWEG